MSSELTACHAGFPSRATLEFSTLLGALSNRLEEGPKGSRRVMAELAPTDRERSILTARRGELVASKLPGDRGAMRRAVIVMFSGFPSVRMDQQAAETTADLYVSTVANFPTWAVNAAARTVVNRATPFPPSCGEFRQEVVDACREVYEEIGAIDQVLGAEVYQSPPLAERERMKDKFASLVRDLSGAAAGR